MARKKAKRGAKQDRPVTIGLLLSHLRDMFENQLTLDVVSAAEKVGVRVICFVGGELYLDLPSNAIYDLGLSEHIDGLIVSPSLGHLVEKDRLRAFCQHYAPLPIVGGALGLDEIPQVLAEGTSGMRQLVEHLVDVHGYRRIAFFQGPAGQPEALERYQAYVDVLEAHGIEIDPSLVFPGDFTAQEGSRAARALIESGVPYDAIVGANDGAALGALHVFREYNIRVPEDVALAGFDDVEEVRTQSAPFTTVRQSFKVMAERMVDLLLRQIEGEDVPFIVTVPTELVIRRSCGCLPASVTNAMVTAREQEHGSALAYPPVDVIPSELWHALIDDIAGDSEDSFLTVLDQFVRQVYEERGNVAGWENKLSVLRQHAIDYFTRLHDQDPDRYDVRVFLAVENLLQQGRVLVGEAARRLISLLRFGDNQHLAEFRFLDQAMATILDLQEIAAVVDAHLPLLGIRHCYLALFDDVQSLDQARLLLAYDEGKVNFYENGPIFPAKQLLPDDLWDASPDDHRVVAALALREQLYGFVCLEFGTPQGMIYERIAGQLSGVIFRARLMAQQQIAQREAEQLLSDVQRRASLLTGAAEISRATTSLMNLPELLTRAVNLICDRFQLYYAGIFLVDKTRQWAVLSAGTGEAGRAMLETGHKLEVDGTSMIGTCVAQGKAFITFDVEHEAHHRRNPLLPDTRSEMALPLISRDQVIGAMTIQSVEPRAFSEDDITALQTMADQLANAIENARLFDQMEQNRRELEIASGRYTHDAWQKFIQNAGQVGYRHQLLGTEPATEMHPEAQEAIQQNIPVITNLISESGSPAGSALGIPVRLRNQVLGVLNLRFDGEMVPPETVALAEQIADRLAISLESARLLQETLNTAEREQRIGRVTSQMRETLDVDSVVRIAAEQIREVLDLSSVMIRLSPNAQRPDEGDV